VICPNHNLVIRARSAGTQGPNFSENPSELGIDLDVQSNLASKTREGNTLMTITANQQFSRMEGLPLRDYAELAALMEAVARLPRDSAEEVIRSLLRAALGYERTGREGYLTSLADAALVTFRTRRDAEDQKALDATPAGPASPEDAMDVDEVLARYGL
jgi:hypothetical protein